MEPSILAIATAIPTYAFDQNEIAKKLILMLNLDEQRAEFIRQLYKNSAISTRYSVVSDFQKERPEWHFWGSSYPEKEPGMAQRNDVYKQEAPKLAYEAANKAMQAWGGNPEKITHVISISCTGVMAPGIEFNLVHLLKLKRSVNRLGINFMGCFGAFKGLSMARSLAKEDASHRILVVCTELCSLHFQAQWNNHNSLANSLFSDGAAAVIIGAEPQAQEKPLWQLVRHHSLALDQTLDKMTWEASNLGFIMTLSPFVPALIGRNIQPFVAHLLNNLTPQECAWPVHPGGKSIIQSIEKALKLTSEQTQAAWETLANYGNMSSATFLFVLERLYQQNTPQKWAVGLGFGPGLSIEGILLRKP